MDLPNLAILFGAYYHQDWMIDDGSAVAVRHRFIKEEPESVVNGAAIELGRLLSLTNHDDDLDTIVFRQLHSYYDPTSEGSSLRQWLLETQQALSDRGS